MTFAPRSAATSAAQRAAFPPPSTATSKASGPRAPASAFNAQRVLHADDAGDTADDVFRLPALDFRIDDPCQQDAGVADDDVNRRNGLRGVVGKNRVAIDRVGDDRAEAVVGERRREHLELVDELLHAVDVRGALGEIVGLDRLRHEAGQRDDAVVDADLDVIEDREVGGAPHLVGDAFGELLIALRLDYDQLDVNHLEALTLLVLFVYILFTTVR